MAPTNSMMCIPCLQNEVDITQDITRTAVVPYCNRCSRFCHSQKWLKAEFESRELMHICMKKIRGLNTVKILDANFLYTEHHSKRIKLKLTVQKEVAKQTILQQDVVTEFVVQYTQCEDCCQAFTTFNWAGQVQVRQATDHKRTFYYLEQCILQAQEYTKISNIKEVPNGLDFQFASLKNAQRFAAFVLSKIPGKKTESKQLVSHDANCNTYKHKFTTLIEVPPVCRDELVYLNKQAASVHCGGRAAFYLVQKVHANGFFLCNPETSEIHQVALVPYWKFPFKSIFKKKALQEFIVMEVQVDHVKTSKASKFKRKLNDQTDLYAYYVTLCRVDDLGTGREVTIRSHLGCQLTAGDQASGYDLRTLDQGEDYSDALGYSPDIILLRRTLKSGEDEAQAYNERMWTLKRLDIARQKKASEEADFEEFKNELMDDEDLRQNVAFYRNPSAQPGGPEAGVLHMLEALDLDEQEVPVGETLEENLVTMEGDDC